MKPFPHFLCIVTAGLLLTACGQRGPLYLPTTPAPATPAVPAQAQAVAPAPAAAATTQSSAPATK